MSVHIEAANKYIDMTCGPLHLEWTMDAYWGLVTQKYLFKGVKDIYSALVAGGYTESNPLDSNDGDNKAFFIPTRNIDRKVFVTTSQNFNLVYIMDKNFDDDVLHVRQFWNEYKRGALWNTVKDLIGTMKKAIQNVETLANFADDHSKYAHRYSLKAYKNCDFSIGYESNNLFMTSYGDSRDSGYVLSYREQNPMFSSGPKVDGSKNSFRMLEMVSTIDIPCTASELKIKYVGIKGY